VFWSDNLFAGAVTVHIIFHIYNRGKSLCCCDTIRVFLDVWPFYFRDPIYSWAFGPVAGTV
jgi:hypothetical protein